jgi:cysteinyl-tRNA synthetase
MTLKIFNTLTRRKEEFLPIEEGKVGFYTCGPTVYWNPHVGNMRAYVIHDLIRRCLTFLRFDVSHVMNYTDVGHLTSDGDTGDDKIEKAAARENKTAREIAEHYIKVFDDDSLSLNIIPPTVTCKATDYIKEQIEIVKQLEEKGYTYITDDGVYFDTSKFPDYGKLGNINVEGLEEGHRVSMGGKKNKTDFALWKFSEEPGKRQQEWNSPWGIGFPGWHTECVVMATAHLGEQFDIHAGGEDHVQVHHTNEIAQAESAYQKKPWVKYWYHVAYLLHKGEKVSKSKGGLYTINELAQMGYNPIVIRYFFLNAHYRKQQNFSIEALDSAKAAMEKLRNHIIEIKEKNDSHGQTAEFRDRFKEAIEDDFNIPQALAVLWEMLKDKDLGNVEKYNLAVSFDSILGLGILDMEEDTDFPEEIMALVKQREKAREKKDWSASDEFRDKIKDLGYIIKDDKEKGSVLQKI